MTKCRSRGAGSGQIKRRTKRQKSAQSTFRESFRLREDETASIGDVYWVRFENIDPVPGRIINITECDGAFEVEFQWFDKQTFAKSKLGHWEWVLTNETDTVSSDTLANKASILRWQEFNARKSHEREKLMYYRLIRNTALPENEKDSYRLSTYDDYEQANPDCDDWMLCACGCQKILEPDDGYAYCTHCSKSTRDDHIEKDSQRATSALRERQGLVYVVDLNSGTEERAKCTCDYRFTSSDTGNESPNNRGLAAPRSTLRISVDVGTTYVRIGMAEENGKPEFYETYSSAVMFPEGQQSPKYKLMLGVRGKLISPLKALIKLDPRTLSVLKELNPSRSDDYLRNYGRKVFGECMGNAFCKFLEELCKHLKCPSRNDLHERYDLLIGVAYPCCFKLLEKQALFTGIYFAARQESTNRDPRIVALPEPVAAFYAIEDLEDGRYLVVDVGGSTTDASIVEKMSPKTIKVIREFGINSGVDTADRLTADWLETQTKMTPCDTLMAVRGWSSKLKEDKKNEKNENHEVYGVDIQNEYMKHWESYWGEAEAHFESIAKSPDVEGIKNIVLCGGGGRSERCQQILEAQFPGKPIQFHDKTARHSHVLTGMEKRLKLSDQTLFSPITLCVEHDEPDGKAEELLVITHRHQALQHAKLPSSQLGEKPVVFDVSFGDGEVCLKLRGTFQEVPFQTNKSGLRIVKQGASLETFFQVGKISIPSERWLSKKLKKKSRGLNVVQFSPCISDGVLLCKGLLISAPTHQTHIENIETMQLDQVKDMVEKTEGLTVCDEYTLVTSLNLNESYRNPAVT